MERLMIPVNIPSEKTKAYEYTPPPKYKVGDKVLLLAPPLAFGLPLDYDTKTVLTVSKEPYRIHSGWTATVTYKGENWEIYENELVAIHK